MKEKRVTKRRQSTRRSDKKMRPTRAQINGMELEKKHNEYIYIFKKEKSF
jgi:hypothetical protein